MPITCIELVVRLVARRGMIRFERDGNAFRLDGPVQSVVPLAIGHRSAGAFVDDDDFSCTM